MVKGGEGGVQCGWGWGCGRADECDGEVSAGET